MTYATAVLLLAGEGERPDRSAAAAPTSGRTATEIALSPIAGEPTVVRILDHLATQGIEEAILAVDAADDRVERLLGHRHAGIDLRYSRDARPLGSGGSLAHALQEHNSHEPIWAITGPTYFACDLLALALVHEANTADVTIALTERADASGMRAVRLARKSNAGGALVDAIYPGSSAAATLVDSGYYLFNPAAFQRFDLPAAFALGRGFLREHLEDLRLIGARVPGAYFDLRLAGEPERAAHYFRLIG